MDLSPHTSRLALYIDKVDPKEDDDNEWLEAGRRMEEPIAKWFADKTGWDVSYAPFMLRSKHTPMMLADPDRYVFDEDLGEWAILEAKNVITFKGSEWLAGPPLHTRMQGQHYLSVTGLNRVHFAALIGGNHFVRFAVDRDDDLIVSMIAGEEKFWTMVQLERMPDPDGSKSTHDALRAHYGDVEAEPVLVGRDFKDLVDSREAHKSAIKLEAKRLEEIESRMIVAMGGADTAVDDNGEIVATWKTTNRKGYTVADTSFRQFYVPKKKP